jgi:hypothetical protein
MKRKRKNTIKKAALDEPEPSHTYSQNCLILSSFQPDTCCRSYYRLFIELNH